MSKTEYQGCDKCKYHTKKEDEYPCNKCIHNAVEKFEPSFTNGDRIREMTDEELIKIIMCPYDTCGNPEEIMPCIREDGEQECVGPEECNKCIMNWLQAESNN